jgi:hypothetical protein
MAAAVWQLLLAPASLLLPTGTCSLQSGSHLHPCAQMPFTPLRSTLVTSIFAVGQSIDQVILAEQNQADALTLGSDLEQ